MFISSRFGTGSYYGQKVPMINSDQRSYVAFVQKTQGESVRSSADGKNVDGVWLRF